MKAYFFYAVTSLFFFVLGQAQQPFSTFDVDSNTVALWHFDENSGNILHDASPYHNDGEIHNCTWVPGKFGSALHFDGLKSYVVLPNSQSLRTVNEFTIEVWVLLDTTYFVTSPYGGQGAAVLSSIGEYPYGGGYGVGFFNNEGFHFDYRSPNSAGYITPSVSPMPAREFFHIAVVYARVILNANQVSVVKSYLNGVLRDSSVFADPIHYENTPNFYIGTEQGGRALGSWAVKEFPGIIDEIRISKIARSPQDFGIPRITVSSQQLSFGLVKLHQTLTQTVTISNPGFYSSLHVDSIISSNPNFTVDLSTFDLLPTSSQIIHVSYTPTQAGQDTALLAIYPREQTGSPLTVGLTGKGFILGEAPAINTVQDVPNDQGRQVRITWYPSVYDDQNEALYVNEYTILRRVDDVLEKQSFLKGKPQGVVFSSGGTRHIVLGTELWDFIARWPALRFEQYSYVAPTLGNATRLGIQWFVYRIVAERVNGDLLFSEPDSGYSIDNEFPLSPEALEGSVDGKRISLSWNAVTARDLAQYNVYRSNSPNIAPLVYSKIGTSKLSHYVDSTTTLDSLYYYSVTANDSSGNESLQSNIVGGFHVLGVKQTGMEIPSTYILKSNYPNPFNPSTTIVFGLPERSRVKLIVYDILGKIVVTLTDDVIDGGYYSQMWTPIGASGIYIYRMEATSMNNSLISTTITQKMLFLK